MRYPKVWETYGIRSLNQASFKIYVSYHIALKLIIFVPLHTKCIDLKLVISIITNCSNSWLIKKNNNLIAFTRASSYKCFAFFTSIINVLRLELYAYFWSILFLRVYLTCYFSGWNWYEVEVHIFQICMPYFFIFTKSLLNLLLLRVLHKHGLMIIININNNLSFPRFLHKHGLHPGFRHTPGEGDVLRRGRNSGLSVIKHHPELQAEGWVLDLEFQA